jgi:hypothetical protein
MPYRIKNGGDARTVTFLAVFAKGEERDFTDEEIESFQAMSGVPFDNGKNLPEGFTVSKVTKKDFVSAEDREAAAQEQQEETVKALTAPDESKEG